jgi:IS605 OrfB family transposase
MPGSRTAGVPHEASFVGTPCRLDALHQVTTRLASRYETVVVEDLNVAGMLGNRRGTPRSQLRGDPRRLARSLADCAFGTLRWQLSYKTSWRGGQLIVADRFFPSSKTCSACGMVKAKLSLAERVFACEGCGLIIDRDVNAARNLLVLAVSGTERVNACGAEVRGPHEAGLVGTPVRPSVAGHTATTGGPREACFAGCKAGTRRRASGYDRDRQGSPRSWLRGVPRHRATGGCGSGGHS